MFPVVDLQGIRAALHRQPFEPFTLRLADGRALPVPHPDFVAVGQRRVVVIGAADSWSVVEPLMVVSLEFNGPSARAQADAGSPDI
jgi:hypothetical protein